MSAAGSGRERAAAAVHQVVADRGLGVLGQPAILRSMLHDATGAGIRDVRAELDLLAALADYNIAGFAASRPGAEAFVDFVRRSAAARSVEPEFVDWATRVWFSALDAPVPAGAADTQPMPPPPPGPVPPPPPSPGGEPPPASTGKRPGAVVLGVTVVAFLAVGIAAATVGPRVWGTSTTTSKQPTTTLTTTTTTSTTSTSTTLAPTTTNPAARYDGRYRVTGEVVSCELDTGCDNYYEGRTYERKTTTKTGTQLIVSNSGDALNIDRADVCTGSLELTEKLVECFSGTLTSVAGAVNCGTTPTKTYWYVAVTSQTRSGGRNQMKAQVRVYAAEPCTAGRANGEVTFTVDMTT